MIKVGLDWTRLGEGERGGRERDVELNELNVSVCSK